MTEQQGLKGDFFDESSGNYRHQQPVTSGADSWVDWALSKWGADGGDEVWSTYEECAPQFQQAIIQKILQTLEIAANDPKQPSGFVFTEMSLYIFIATEDPVLESCGITDATELKRLIKFLGNFTEDQRQEFLTRGEPEVLIPFLQRVITEAGRICDAQCELSGSGPVPSVG